MKNEKPAFVIVYQCLNCDYSFAHLYDYGVSVNKYNSEPVEINSYNKKADKPVIDELNCNKCGYRGIEIIERSMIEY